MRDAQGAPAPSPTPCRRPDQLWGLAKGPCAGDYTDLVTANEWDTRRILWERECAMRAQAEAADERRGA